MYRKDNRLSLVDFFFPIQIMHVTIPRKFRHMIWENKIDQRKRFINATEKLGKIEELALHLVFFIQIRQLKEKAFPLVMRDAFLLP